MTDRENHRFGAAVVSWRRNPGRRCIAIAPRWLWPRLRSWWRAVPTRRDGPHCRTMAGAMSITLMPRRRAPSCSLTVMRATISRPRHSDGQALPVPAYWQARLPRKPIHFRSAWPNPEIVRNRFLHAVRLDQYYTDADRCALITSHASPRSAIRAAQHVDHHRSMLRRQEHDNDIDGRCRARPTMEVRPIYPEGARGRHIGLRARVAETLHLCGRTGPEKRT